MAKEEPKTEKAPATHDKPEEEENSNVRFLKLLYCLYLLKEAI